MNPRNLFSVIGLIALLAGCSAPPASLKIEAKKGSHRDDAILLGTLELPSSGWGEWAGVLNVTDGELTCNGEDTGSKVDTGWKLGRIQHTLEIQCSDGRMGKVQVSLSGTIKENMSGVGVGKLNDGSKVRMIVGDAVGTLAW